MKFINKAIFSVVLGGLTILAGCQSKQTQKAQQTEASSTKAKVIGYVAGWTGNIMSQIEVKKLTHINYAFANIRDGQVVFENESDGLNLDTLQMVRDKQNPDLKILVSIGGWVWSNHFSDVALTQESRDRFTESAVAFLKEHQLDGLDIDWEYPGQIGEDNVFRPEDKENFTLFLRDLRKGLDAQGKKDGKIGENHYLLTIASGADQAYIDHTDLGEAQKHLDFINIMTYDFYNGLHHTTGHHSNFKMAGRDDVMPLSIETSVQGHVKAGVPIEKIVLGVPFYGRIWTGVEKKNNGLYQKAESVGTITPYKTIMTECTETQGFADFWDEVAQAPYKWNEKEGIFISYETPKSMANKIQFVKEKGMGGAMFWEYSDDYNSELLHTLSDGILK